MLNNSLSASTFPNDFYLIMLADSGLLLPELFLIRFIIRGLGWRICVVVGCFFAWGVSFSRGNNFLFMGEV